MAYSNCRKFINLQPTNGLENVDIYFQINCKKYEVNIDWWLTSKLRPVRSNKDVHN